MSIKILFVLYSCCCSFRHAIPKLIIYKFRYFFCLRFAFQTRIERQIIKLFLYTYNKYVLEGKIYKINAKCIGEFVRNSRKKIEFITCHNNISSGLFFILLFLEINEKRKNVTKGLRLRKFRN